MKTLRRANAWLTASWLLWASVLGQQLFIHSWHGSWLADNPRFSRVTFFVLLAPLVASIGLRWLVLPRLKSTVVIFLVFFAGIILAAWCGFSSSFLDLPYHEIIFTLSLLGITEFIPLRSLSTTEPDSPVTPPARRPPRQP